MIHEIDLDGAKQLVRDLPFRDLGPEDIKEIRNILQLSQVPLADFLGVADNTVYRWETGRNDVPKNIGLAITALCFMRITYEAEKSKAELERMREQQARNFINPDRERKIFGAPQEQKTDENDENTTENVAEIGLT